MSDNSQLPEDPARARREVRIQNWGRGIVSTLYMLIRNVKIHSPDNAVFLKPIDSLKDTINNVIAAEGRMNLYAVETSVYLNNAQLKFDFNALDSVKFLSNELQARELGGFLTEKAITSKEIRDFLQLFTSNARALESEDDQPLDAIKLSSFRRVREILEKLDEEPLPDQQIDRKKYLFTVYARTVFFMRKYFEKVAQEDFSLPLAKAGRLVQDFVDLSIDQRVHFLGLTTCKSDDDYLPFHSANTCLISIVFGSELGLDKRQLHDLGMSALFSQVGLASLPRAMLDRKGGLTESERRLVDLYPLRTAKTILATRGLDQTTMHRIVSAYESHVDYARAKKRPDGEVELVKPKVGLSVFGRIIAIAGTFDALTSRRPFREPYGPHIALALMASELKHRFDPDLLRVFMKVMAIQPVRIVESARVTAT